MKKPPSDFLKAQEKVFNRIYTLEGRGVLSCEEADDLAYWIEAAGRLHEAGDVNGAWDLLKDVVRNVPTIRIHEDGEAR